MLSPQDDFGYQAARQAAAFFYQDQAGYLRLSGEDQSAFLQRQTTNDLRQLAPDRALLTVLTSPTARILDVLILLQESDAIGLLTLPGRPGATFRFLKSRIFFNDRVTLIDASAEIAQVDLIGPQAGEILAALGAEPAGEVEQVIPAVVRGIPVRAFRLSPAFGLGFRLLVAAAGLQQVLASLEQAGASRIEAEVYQILRVEGGLPEAGHELTEEHTPLETGLESAVSDGKGCYTGQEVLARQINYEKVTHRLCGLKLQGAVEPGDRVWAIGKPVGKITSSVVSPRLGHIALAVLRRPNDEPGAAVKIGGDPESGMAGVVVPLPFQEL